MTKTFKEKLDEESNKELKELINTSSFTKELVQYNSQNNNLSITKISNSTIPNKCYFKIAYKNKDNKFKIIYLNHFNKQIVKCNSWNELLFYLEQFEQQYNYNIFPLQLDYTQWGFNNVVTLRNFYAENSHFWHIRLSDNLISKVGLKNCKKCITSKTREEGLFKLNTLLPTEFKIPKLVMDKY